MEIIDGNEIKLKEYKYESDHEYEYEYEYYIVNIVLFVISCLSFILFRNVNVLLIIVVIYWM